MRMKLVYRQDFSISTRVFVHTLYKQEVKSIFRLTIVRKTPMCSWRLQFNDLNPHPKTNRRRKTLLSIYALCALNETILPCLTVHTSMSIKRTGRKGKGS
jgi:hypothetical protein